MTSRVFIAMPSGRANPDIECVTSLNGTMQDLRAHNIEYSFHSIHGNCYIALVRSLMTHQFMQSECTHLFFWDDDVAAPHGALRRLLGYNRDIIVAAYPKKVPLGSPPEKTWPIALVDGVPDEAGLLESDMVATGFLLIRRNVIEAMYEKYADCVFHHREGSADIIDLFPTGIIKDEAFPRNALGKDMWWGEDYSFSVLAKQASFKIWMDPKIQLLHAGRNVWFGNFAQQAAD